MRASKSILFSALVLLAMSGCVHTHRFNPSPRVDPVSGTKLNGHTVAIDVSQVPQNETQHANGHTYHMLGIRTEVSSMLHSIFANDKVVPDASKADTVLKIGLNLDLGWTLIGTKCTATARCDIMQKGTTVASGQDNASAAVPTTAAGGQNCEIATLKAIPKAIDDAMAKLQ